MAAKRQALLFISIATAILLPALALAEGSGLVPCGIGTTYNAATQCQACNVVELLQNIITFMLELAIPVAVAMFAYGGFLYFTSGASLGAIGGSENISKAKKIFQNAIFGFLVALTGWLVINTILNLVLDAAQYPSGSWFKVDCVSDSSRLRSENIGDVLLKDIGLAPTGVVANCSEGYTYTDVGVDSTGNTIRECVNDKDPTDVEEATYTSAGSGDNPQQCDTVNCSVSTLINAGMSQTEANVMSCIAQTESSGISTYCNGHACGTFQIELSIHPLVGSACSSYSVTNCTTSSYCDGGHKASSAACNACIESEKAAAKNYMCNAETAAHIVDVNGYSDWTPPSSDNQHSAACVEAYGH